MVGTLVVVAPERDMCNRSWPRRWFHQGVRVPEKQFSDNVETNEP